MQSYMFNSPTIYFDFLEFGAAVFEMSYVFKYKKKYFALSNINIYKRLLRRNLLLA